MIVKPFVNFGYFASDILFSIPLILAFCGDWGRAVVADGFTALEAMPQYYQFTLGTIVAASFGMRSASKFFGKK